MAKRQYFKTKVNLHDKYRRGTRLHQEKAKRENDAFLKSPEGRAALARIGLADSLSSAFAARVVSNSKQVDNILDSLNERLASKVINKPREDE